MRDLHLDASADTATDQACARILAGLTPEGYLVDGDA
jgi:hypothetical protein